MKSIKVQRITLARKEKAVKFVNSAAATTTATATTTTATQLGELLFKPVRYLERKKPHQQQHQQHQKG